MPKKPGKPTVARDVSLPKKASSLTLIDVAKVAGVSPMTVSRALHRPELVSEETRDKVREAVRKTGYVSNMLAGWPATRAVWWRFFCRPLPTPFSPTPCRR